jgi:hypothetical protein
MAVGPGIQVPAGELLRGACTASRKKKTLAAQMLRQMLEGRRGRAGGQNPDQAFALDQGSVTSTGLREK